MIVELLMDAVKDCVTMLPFLFVAFLLMETLERYSGNAMEQILIRFRWLGPVAGAILGCIPQCGFSVMAANLFSGGMISTGTILATFLSTSDEAVLILLGEPEGRGVIWHLILTKVIIAAVAGIITDIVIKAFKKTPVAEKNICKDCGCEEDGILISSVRHVIKIIGYLFVITFLLNILIEYVGIGRLSVWLLTDSPIQPLLAGIIGLIPNCAISVMLTKLYMESVISFGAVISGLSAGAGIGMIVLWKMNENKKESAMIVGLLFVVSVLAGYIVG